MPGCRQNTRTRIFGARVDNEGRVLLAMRNGGVLVTMSDPLRHYIKGPAGFKIWRTIGLPKALLGTD